MIRFLRGPALANIRFVAHHSRGPIQVGGRGFFGQLADAFSAQPPKVDLYLMDEAYVRRQRNPALYKPRYDQLILPQCKQCADIEQNALLETHRHRYQDSMIVHESVHAIRDSGKQMVGDAAEEVVAYLAQFAYVFMGAGREAPGKEIALQKATAAKKPRRRKVCSAIAAMVETMSKYRLHLPNSASPSVPRAEFEGLCRALHHAWPDIPLEPRIKNDGWNRR